MFYQQVVFLDGDRADEFLDVLYNRESPESIVYHGPTSESIDATFAAMVETFGEGGAEISEAPGSGSADDSWTQDGYYISAHLGLGYIGLDRLVEDAHGTPAWMPPTEMDVADAHGGFTAMIPDRKLPGWGRFNTLWRPASIAKKGTTGARVTGSVKHDAQYQNQRPVISAEYKLPGYGYRAMVWFTQAGERIA
jgi:hypothetical protein